MKLQFYIRFHTEFGQSLWISGNIDELGNDDPANALLMEYLDYEFWNARVEVNRKGVPKNGIRYKFFLKTKEGELVSEWGHDRMIDVSRKDLSEIDVVDTWNHAGEYENSFFTAPFNKVLLKQPVHKNKTKATKDYTHVFKLKAPLLKKHEAVCLLGFRSIAQRSTSNLLYYPKKGWWTANSICQNNFLLRINMAYSILRKTHL
jgi:4-alpha-glucanotransferase